ncbi:MAG TPA: type I-F CRISPR-associated protein Csy1 [Accumulibacter sp.]|nr:type I-F CRISPR-associated protein Csy1 [Accumulibacter sp.]HNF91581.1 type I-F CRISPR-associated protein Csy1 [Accumulibacter sp.]
MATHGNSPQTVAALKVAIAGFLAERLQAKLDKLKPEAHDARQRLVDEHRPEIWIADAARRVGQIQQVTHAVKFTHPSAEGTSLSSPGNPAEGECVVGTHVLGAKSASDVVGNAAALDVYKFLRIEVDGTTLLERVMAGDGALAEALSDDAAEAACWLAAFARLPEPKSGANSHKLAKQVFWPVGDGGYHLLSPLFSSPLAHAVHRRITDDRFSEPAKAARAAHKSRRAHPHGYRDYPDVVIQRFGGSQPQNISQLNSERRGENYLLPSLPPRWEEPPLRAPRYCATVFGRYFERRDGVRRQAAELRNFLRSVARATSTMRIRDTRAEMVITLCNELLQMAAEVRHGMAPGWTASEECRLDRAEQYWLDPWRADLDPAFASDRQRGDWQDEVCQRFAVWLNNRLRTDLTLFGDPEAQAWRSVLAQELRLVREELPHD